MFTSHVDEFGKPKSSKDWVPIKDGNEFVSSETKKPRFGDESDSSKSEEPCSGDESDSSKLEEQSVEVKGDDSVSTMDDANFPSLSNENSKQKIGKPKDRQAWVDLFK
ncbi:hypothetical protein HanXRQr2_Chr03g0101791 [Helianthus annuus]|uniref:Uncharacterized protein n=1 Tax=Helianthus annuus TaxID=4232 RepID=A0A9K3NW40_HELAN|nr:hypothetical protein HanXRQr2_Chr03g0101791 [Helianthus annuus]